MLQILVSSDEVFKSGLRLEYVIKSKSVAIGTTCSGTL